MSTHHEKDEPSLCASLARVISQVAGMRRYVQNGKPKPHKIIMLLAVISLAEDGLLSENRIAYSAPLVERFHRLFHEYPEPDDLSQPTIPFFHLRSASFWSHSVREGRAEAYRAIRKMGAAESWITDNIEYAYLSPEAFAVVESPAHRRLLKEFLILLLQEQDASS